MLGPNILAYNSFLGLAESQLDYVIDGLRKAEREGAEVLEVREDAFRTYNDEIQAALRPTVFNNGGCSSYYLDVNGKNFAAWPWSTRTLTAPSRQSAGPSGGCAGRVPHPVHAGCRPGPARWSGTGSRRA